MAVAAATVLTVDDDPVVRADLRLVLEDAGFEVCADARDGIEAVELARTEKPDVILLDLALPRLDGVQATRRILDERQVPIVAVTGYGSESGGMADRAVAAGAVAVVRKPFSEGAVVDAVAGALTGAVDGARDRSRAAIAEVLVMLGYPEDWASTLEGEAFRAGKVWRRVDDGLSAVDD
jgi:two-component system, response regulator PdtaR